MSPTIGVRAAGAPVRTPDWLSGHVWTVGLAALAQLWPGANPPGEHFETVVNDAAIGPVRLTGILSEHPDSETIVVIVHGLSGSARSPYCTRAARAVAAAGYSSLRLSLRGADGSGEDLFHGGTTEDIGAALAAPALAKYRRVLLLGYSAGGHIALRAAVDPVDARLRAVCAVCPPLDLRASTAAFDQPERSYYRRRIFRSLNRAYTAMAARGRALVPADVVFRAESCAERDSLTVVPRFGFRNTADYHERESVAHRLWRLEIPSLLVAARQDPIIPAETLLPAISTASPALGVAWAVRGGHVYFPGDFDLGEAGPLGLESQVIQWLARQ
ncbi:MAG: alpha/beta fold hydrolase [Bryobacteraceae bacterium]